MESAVNQLLPCPPAVRPLDCGIVTSPRILRLTIPPALEFFKPADRPPLQDDEVIIKALKSRILLAHCLHPSIEEGSESMSLKPTSHRLDTWCVSQILQSEGLRCSEVDRVFNMLLVNSTGFYAIVENVRRASEDSRALTTNVWRVFSLLLQHTAPKDTKYELRIKTILDQSYTNAQSRRIEVQRKNEHAEQMLSEYNRRLLGKKQHKRSLQRRQNALEKRQCQLRAKIDGLKATLKEIRQKSEELSCQISSVKLVFEQKAELHLQWKKRSNEQCERFLQVDRIKNEKTAILSEAKARLNPIHASIRDEKVQSKSYQRRLENLLAMFTKAEEMQVGLNKDCEELVLLLKEKARELPPLHDSAIQLIAKREELQSSYMASTKEGTSLAARESDAMQRLVECEAEHEFLTLRSQTMNETLRTISEDAAYCATSLPQKESSVNEALERVRLWENKAVGLQVWLDGLKQLTQALEKDRNKLEKLFNHDTTKLEKVRTEMDKLNSERMKVIDLHIPNAEVQIEGLRKEKMHLDEAFVKMKKEGDDQIAKLAKERERASLSAEDQISRVGMLNAILKKAQAGRAQVQDLIAAEGKATKSMQKEMKEMQNEIDEQNSVEAKLEQQFREQIQHSSLLLKRHASLLARAEGFRNIDETKKAEWEGFARESTQASFHAAEVIVKLKLAVTDLKTRKTNLEDTIAKEEDEFATWKKEHDIQCGAESAKRHAIFQVLDAQLNCIRRRFEQARIEANSRAFAYRRHYEDLSQLKAKFREKVKQAHSLDEEISIAGKCLSRSQAEYYALRRRYIVRAAQLGHIVARNGLCLHRQHLATRAAMKKRCEIAQIVEEIDEAMFKQAHYIDAHIRKAITSDESAQTFIDKVDQSTQSSQ